MGAGVAAAVEAMDLREGKSLIRNTTPLFGWRPVVPINNEEQLDYEVIHEDNLFVEENRAVMAQGNKIMHDAGDTDEQPNLKLTSYINNEIVDAPEPTSEKS